MFRHGSLHSSKGIIARQDASDQREIETRYKGRHLRCCQSLSFIGSLDQRVQIMKESLPLFVVNPSGQHVRAIAIKAKTGCSVQEQQHDRSGV